MSAPTDGHDNLGDTLRTLDAQAVDAIRRARVRVAWPAALRSALPLLVLGGLAFLLLRGFGVLPHSGVPAALLGALVVLGPYALGVFARVGQAETRGIEDGLGLALVDRRCGLEDRLGAARDLLRHANPTDFEQAAIDDARAHLDQAHLDRALRDDEPLDAAAPISTTARAPWIAAAVALVALGLLFSPRVASVADEEPEVAQVPTRVVQARTPDPTRDDEPPPREAQPRAPHGKTPKGKPTTPSEQKVPGRLDDDMRASAGKTQAGAASEAGAPSQATRATSAPSEQGQAGEGARKARKKSTKKPTPSKEPSKVDMRASDKIEKSGATTGSTSSKGKSKNPASNTWSSKDSVPDIEGDPAQDDDEVDDDDEESEARGGMQPTLRSRKPPVNRDLGVGFGNQSNLDANGRGGQGARKKSRGTASLILGVPIPDHVRGMPNRGRTKVTQERVQPEREPAPNRVAVPHTMRARPGGRVPSLDLTPWMQRIVRDYFLAFRAAQEKESR